GIEVLRATKQDRMLFMASVSGAVALVAGGFILTHQFGPMGMVAANYLPVGAIFVIIAMLRTIRTQFLSLARQLAVVYVVSFTVSSAAFVFGGTGLTRHIAGILAVIVLWAFFYKKYGLTEGKETLGLL
ncbi:MAG TPA: hypothetical protein PLU88_15825, partial [Armatimonadota bacterium]|nr:hypothetical protein [Armatimonadota bacterium]